MTRVSVASLLLRSRAAASPFCNKPSSSHTPSLYFCHQLVRNMSSSGDFLINEPKYAFLKDLGLDTLNNGVYHGKWTGSGEVRNKTLDNLPNVNVRLKRLSTKFSSFEYVISKWKVCRFSFKFLGISLRYLSI